MGISTNRTKSAALFLAALFAAPAAQAFTLGSESSSQLGWSADTVNFNYNFADCGVSEDDMLEALELAAEVFNGVATSRLTVNAASSVSTAIAAAAQKYTDRINDGSLSATRPELICSTNFSADAGGADA
ncbi:MAG: hypothetical protein IT285_06880, partial [Bdellovibrionales bacterium]|nr:hypothetical protein [Bdellovibrionales bacterium]